MKQILLLFGIILYICSCTDKKKTSCDKVTIEQEILQLGKSVVWALNEANTDTLIRDFWQSDSALFLIDGFRVQGYERIRSLLKGIPNRRKKLVLDVDDEMVLVLTENMAIHVVEFNQKVTHMNDSISTDKGIWSTVYKKMQDDWKIIMVHESHLISKDN